MEKYWRDLLALILRWSRRLWQGKGLWLRVLLSLTVGVGILIADTQSNFDFRFRLRGLQPQDSRITLLLITQEEWLKLQNNSQNWIRRLKEFTNLTDSYFWHPRLWEQILSKLLVANPLAVGVTFYFSDKNVAPSVPARTDSLFRDSRVFWGTQLDGEERPMTPAFSDSFLEKVGLINMRTDEDGVLRRYQIVDGQFPHLSLVLAQSVSNVSWPSYFKIFNDQILINFRGPGFSFPVITLSDLLSPDFDLNSIKGKLILIGSADLEGHIYQTPLGKMTRAEVVANMVDNLTFHRDAVRSPFFLNVLVLLLLLFLTAWLVSNYPQSLALVFIIGVGTIYASLSLWIFDQYYLWTPLLAPLMEMGFAYVLFVGFQLTMKENQTWRLEQEKKYIFEVEQLKSNFMSLISHDLKTPIAKIQAICDRLLGQRLESPIQTDVTALRRESAELHRYIQSILQLSRVESRNFKINREAYDINEIIYRAVDQLKPLAQQKNMTVETALEPLFLVEVDSTLIYEVLLNVIENAIKYTQNGGSIRVVSKEYRDRVFVTVEDNGPGIPAEDQLHIFQKFYRGQANDTKISGSGLGLYLVKYFIELHEGEIVFQSRQGQGTKVGFSLPLVDDSLNSPQEGFHVSSDKSIDR